MLVYIWFAAVHQTNVRIRYLDLLNWILCLFVLFGVKYEAHFIRIFDVDQCGSSDPSVK